MRRRRTRYRVVLRTVRGNQLWNGRRAGAGGVGFIPGVRDCARVWVDLDADAGAAAERKMVEAARLLDAWSEAHELFVRRRLPEGAFRRPPRRRGAVKYLTVSDAGAGRLALLVGRYDSICAGVVEANALRRDLGVEGSNECAGGIQRYFKLIRSILHDGHAAGGSAALGGGEGREKEKPHGR